jgi:hypothetical protein
MPVVIIPVTQSGQNGEDYLSGQGGQCIVSSLAARVVEEARAAFPARTVSEAA